MMDLGLFSGSKLRTKLDTILFAYSSINVREIREKTKKSQVDFARMIGVKVGTLRNWEQGRRKPNGTALTLLKVVAADPEYVESVLQI